jgi:hypothetical protein
MPGIYDDINSAIDSGGYRGPERPEDYTAIPSTEDITTPTTPPPQQTWGELGSDVYKELAGTSAQQLGSGFQYFGAPDTGAALKAWGGREIESMSPAGKEISESPTWSGFRQHPVSKVAQGLGSQGLWAPLGAAAGIATGGLGDIAGGALLAGGGALLATTSSYGDVADQIASIPDDVAQKTIPEYQRLRTFMPMDQAKTAVTNEAWAQLNPATKIGAAAGGAIAGYAGPLAGVGRLVEGAASKMILNFGKGMIPKALAGATEAGAVTGLQSGTQALATKQALDAIGAPSQSYGDIAAGTAEATGIGAAVGGVVGARLLPKLFRRGQDRPAEPEGGKSGEGVGSDRVYPKDQAAQPAGGGVTVVQPGKPDLAETSALQSATHQPTPPQPHNYPKPPFQPSPFSEAPTVWPGMGEEGPRRPPPTPPPGPDRPAGPPPPPPPPPTPPPAPERTGASIAPPVPPPTPPPDQQPPVPLTPVRATPISPLRSPEMTGEGLSKEEYIKRFGQAAWNLKEALKQPTPEVTKVSEEPAKPTPPPAAPTPPPAPTKGEGLKRGKAAAPTPASEPPPAAPTPTKGQALKKGVQGFSPEVQQKLTLDQALQRIADRQKEEGTAGPTEKIRDTSFEEEPPAPTKEVSVTKLPPTAPQLKPLKISERTKAIAAAYFPPEVTPKGAAKLRTLKAAKETVKKSINEARGEEQIQLGHPSPSETGGLPVTITSPTGAGRLKRSSNNIPGKPLETLHVSNDDTGKYYVINRLNSDTGEFQNHVIATGAHSATAAKEKFMSEVGMTRARPTGIAEPERVVGGIVEMTKPEIDDFIANHDRGQPVHPDTTWYPGKKIETMDGKIVQTLGSNSLYNAIRDDAFATARPEFYIANKLGENFMSYLPDVPVYYIRQADMDRVIGQKGISGAYVPVRNHILISDDPDMNLTTTLLHEAGHAATMYSYRNDNVYRGLTNRLYKEFRDGLTTINEIPKTANLRTGDPQELLADIVRPSVAAQASKVMMSDKLAKDLNMTEWKGATHSIWAGLVKAFTDSVERLSGIKLPFGEAKYSIMEGVLRLQDQEFIQRSKLAKDDFGKLLRASEEAKPSAAEKDSRETFARSINDVTHDERKFEKDKSTWNSSVAKAAMGLHTDVGSKAWASSQKFLTRAYNNIYNAHQWGATGVKNPLTILSNLLDNRESRMMDVGDEKRAIETRGLQLRKQYGGKGKWADLVAIQQNSQMFGYHPDEPLGQGRNAHITPNSLNGPRTIEQYKEFKPIWDKLPKDLQQYYQDRREVYKVDGAWLQRNFVNDAVKPVDDRQGWKNVDREDFIKRAMEGKLTDDMKEWAVEQGILHTKSEADELVARPGPYFPTGRHGDQIIYAKYNVPVPANAEKLDDRTYGFKTLQEAQDFQKGLTLYSDVHQAREHAQDPTTGEMYKPWLVKFNNEYFSTAETKSKAEAVAAQVSKYLGIDKNSIRVEKKREHGQVDYELAGPLAKRLASQINKSADYGKDEKAQAIKMLMDAVPMVQTRQGFSGHLIRSRNVEGADTDILTSDALYNREFAVYKAKKEFDAPITAAFKNLEEEHKRLSAAGQGDGWKRSVILSRMEKDIGEFGSSRFMGKDMPQFARDLISTTGIRTLMSPGHVITHPMRASYGTAELAAKFGPSAVWKVTKFMRMFKFPFGGTMEALQSAGHAMRGDVDTFDGFNYLMRQAGKVGGEKGAELQRALQALKDTNDIRGGQNIDLNFYRDAVQAGPFRVLRDMLSRADMATHKIMGIGETINRGVIGMAAYESARDKGMNEAAAQQVARDILTRSMGKFGPGQRMPIATSRFMQIPLQLRNWGLQMVMSLFNNLVNIRHMFGNGREARVAGVEALKSLTYKMLAAGVLAGGTGMLPGADILKIATRASKAMGITNEDFEDWENDVRDYGRKTFGDYWGTVLADGFPAGLGPFSVHVGGRVSLESLITYNIPSFDKADDVWSTIGKALAGAAGDTVINMYNGVSDALKGNWYDAGRELIPVKAVDDLVKGYKGAIEGVSTRAGVHLLPPYGTPQMIMQMLGISPEQVSLAQEGHYYAGREIGQTIEAKKAILTNVSNSQGADRLRAMQEVIRFNREHPTSQITHADLNSAIRKATLPRMMGIPMTKRNLPILQKYQGAYGGYGG